MGAAALSAEVDQLRQENETLTRRVQELLEALRIQIHRQYGASSEQTPPAQARLFDEPGDELDQEAGAKVVDEAATARPRWFSPEIVNT